MVSFHKPVAGVIPGMMSLALVGKSAKLADDSLKGKAKQGDFIKSSIDILVGVEVIGDVLLNVGITILLSIIFIYFSIKKFNKNDV